MKTLNQIVDEARAEALTTLAKAQEALLATITATKGDEKWGSRVEEALLKIAQGPKLTTPYLYDSDVRAALDILQAIELVVVPDENPHLAYSPKSKREWLSSPTSVSWKEGHPYAGGRLGADGTIKIPSKILMEHNQEDVRKEIMAAQEYLDRCLVSQKDCDDTVAAIQAAVKTLREAYESVPSIESITKKAVRAGTLITRTEGEFGVHPMRGAAIKTSMVKIVESTDNGTWKVQFGGRKGTLQVPKGQLAETLAHAWGGGHGHLYEVLTPQGD